MERRTGIVIPQAVDEVLAQLVSRTSVYVFQGSEEDLVPLSTADAKLRMAEWEAEYNPDRQLTHEECLAQVLIY
tara:strand:+ start:399 stop:620 length:222 start_codon:yes stop_codon:yes gene_type:complete